MPSSEEPYPGMLCQSFAEYSEKQASDLSDATALFKRIMLNHPEIAGAGVGALGGALTSNDVRGTVLGGIIGAGATHGFRHLPGDTPEEKLRTIKNWLAQSAMAKSSAANEQPQQGYDLAGSLKNTYNDWVKQYGGGAVNGAIGAGAGLLGGGLLGGWKGALGLGSLAGILGLLYGVIPGSGLSGKYNTIAKYLNAISNNGLTGAGYLYLANNENARKQVSDTVGTAVNNAARNKMQNQLTSSSSWLPAGLQKWVVDRGMKTVGWLLPSAEDISKEVGNEIVNRSNQPAQKQPAAPKPAPTPAAQPQAATPAPKPAATTSTNEVATVGGPRGDGYSRNLLGV